MQEDSGASRDKEKFAEFAEKITSRFQTITQIRKVSNCLLTAFLIGVIGLSNTWQMIVENFVMRMSNIFQTYHFIKESATEHWFGDVSPRARTQGM